VIVVMVDSLKYLTPLALDILAACIVEVREREGVRECVCVSA
jgi:hypothetical protein